MDGIVCTVVCEHIEIELRIGRHWEGCGCVDRVCGVRARGLMRWYRGYIRSSLYHSDDAK